MPVCHRGCSRAWPADRCCPRSSSRTGRRAPGRRRSGGARRASSGSRPGARAASPSPRTDRPRRRRPRRSPRPASWCATSAWWPAWCAAPRCARPPSPAPDRVRGRAWRPTSEARASRCMAWRHGLHMAMRARCGDLEALRYRLQSLAAQCRANGLDLRRRQARQIGQRALADLGAFAIGLAQQHGGRRASVRHNMNMHAYIYTSTTSKIQEQNMPTS